MLALHTDPPSRMINILGHDRTSKFVFYVCNKHCLLQFASEMYANRMYRYFKGRHAFWTHQNHPPSRFAGGLRLDGGVAFKLDTCTEDPHLMNGKNKRIKKKKRLKDRPIFARKRLSNTCSTEYGLTQVTERQKQIQRTMLNSNR